MGFTVKVRDMGMDNNYSTNASVSNLPILTFSKDLKHDIARLGS